MPRPIEYGPQSAAPGDEKLVARIRGLGGRRGIKACDKHPGCVVRFVGGRLVSHEDAFTSLRATEGQLVEFQETAEETRRLVTNALRQVEAARRSFLAEASAFRQEAEGLRAGVANLGIELRRRIEYAEAEINAEVEAARRRANRKIGELAKTRAELRRELEDLLRSVEQETERLKNRQEALRRSQGGGG